MKKRIKFIKSGMSKTGKTKVWEVFPLEGKVLGEIYWYGRWRCYAFFPRPFTPYEKDCLRRIADFCEAESTKARSGWQKGRGKNASSC